VKAERLAVFGGIPWAVISLAEMYADADPTVELVFDAKMKPLTLKKTPSPEAAIWLKEPALTVSSWTSDITSGLAFAKPTEANITTPAVIPILLMSLLLTLSL
jgi:hypothetical protein